MINERDSAFLMAFAIHGFVLMTDKEFINTRVNDKIPQIFGCGGGICYDINNQYYFNAINSPYSKINYFFINSDIKIMEKFASFKDEIVKYVGKPNE